MANSFCKICQNSRVYSKERKPQLDLIESTTSCRLVLNGGTVLKINEIQTEVDEEAKLKNLKCLCRVPSDDNFIQKKKYKNFNNKKSKENETNSKKRLMQEIRKLKKKLYAIDRTCINKFEKIVTPKWFIPFISKQVDQLHRLPSAVEDDGIENVLRRTRRILLSLGVSPMFPDSLISSSLKHSNNNVVLLLVGLLKMMQVDRLSSMRNHSNDPYFPNEQILMSAICWFELPVLLTALSDGYLQDQDDPSNKSLNQYRTGDSPTKLVKNSNPYLEPLLPSNPFDWLTEKNLDLINRRRKGNDLRRIQLPADIYRIAHFTHISFSNMKIEKDKSEISVVSVPDQCFVFAAFEAPTNMSICPCTPPGTRYSPKKESLDKVSSILKGALNKLKDTCSTEEEDIHREEYFDMTLQRLVKCGVICASFPDILDHPSVTQLNKHINGERMMKSLRNEIWKKVLSAASCLRELYPQKELCISRNLNPGTTWANVGVLRKKANADRTKFLSTFLNQRLRNSIKFYHTLSPCYFSKHSFNGTFYAYMPSAADNVNFWYD